MIKEIVKNQSFYKNTFGISAKCHYLYVKLLKIRMMKKLFLLSAVGALGALSASAQVEGKSSSITKSESSLKAVEMQMTSISTPTPVGSSLNNNPKDSNPLAKTTAGGTRWYSYSDYLGLKESSIEDSTSFPYLWGKVDAMAIYNFSSGLAADTITMASYGMTFDPAFKSSTTSIVLQGFNDPFAYDNSNIVVTRSKSYVLDSVRVWGIYGRNLSKTKTDTLRIAIVQGKADGSGDLGGIITWGPDTKATYGNDTLNINNLEYDAATRTASGTTRVIKDVYLNPSDTSLSNVRNFMVGVNMNVTAGNIVGVSVTFLSGETYTPNVDTAYVGGTDYKLGMVRPLFFADPTGLASGYPTYEKGWSNVGFVKYLPNIYNSFYDDKYMSMYSWTAPFQSEIPAIDFLITCSSCNTIKELSIKESTVLSQISAFPNPANTQLNVPVSVSETANVTVSISNMLGQVIATQNLGSMNAGQKETAVFNTTSLSAGVYLYTVEANGQRVSNRFSVSH
ncbi:MAG: T9SS type A sorting domain-containing protein [Chitinophagaceae bacterium]|jgi:hypothetical protein